MKKIQVNVTSAVGKAGIRREQHNGREHFVISSKTLPFDVVMNGGLYPRSEIESHYQKLEGTLAPLGHPQVNGKFVSAFSAEGINGHHVGAWNRNAKIEGNRVSVEKWLDIEFAKNTENGKRLLERLEGLENGNGTPIHTSVAVWLEKELTPNAEGYDWTARITGIDHDAILLDEEGAATPAQGVGLMVNADAAEPVAAKPSAMEGQSYRELEQKISRAASAKFASAEDEYAWVADFTDTQAVIVLNGSATKVYAYSSADGKIVFEDEGTTVEKQESWVTIVANKLKKTKEKFFQPQARLALNEEAEMPMTPEEKTELLAEVGTAIDEKLKPIADAIAELQGKKKEEADAEKKAADEVTANKRKTVAAKFGEIVANSLSGAALDLMLKNVDEAEVLAGNSAQDAPATGTPDFNTYAGA